MSVGCSDDSASADRIDGAIPADAEVPQDGEVDGQAPDCAPYRFEDVMIPMRDGNFLSAFVRRPMDEACRLPAILIQTPYNKENARTMWFDDPSGEPLFESADYAFVVVDWRGFFGSAQAAVTGTQPYGEDGYDTVEWIAAQSFSDGKVGTWGVSALCVQQYRTAVEQPPHLAAAGRRHGAGERADWIVGRRPDGAVLAGGR